MADKHAIADPSVEPVSWWQRLGVWIASNVFRLAVAPRVAANDDGERRPTSEDAGGNGDVEDLSWIHLVDGDALVTPSAPIASTKRTVDVIDVRAEPLHLFAAPTDGADASPVDISEPDPDENAVETAVPEHAAVPVEEEAPIAEDARDAISDPNAVESISVEAVDSARNGAEVASDNDEITPLAADDATPADEAQLVDTADERSDSDVDAAAIAEATAPAADAAGEAVEEQAVEERVVAHSEMEPDAQALIPVTAAAPSDRAEDGAPGARRTLTDAERAPRRPRPVDEGTPKRTRQPRDPNAQRPDGERRPRKPMFVMEPTLPDEAGMHNAYSIHDVLDALPDYFDHLKALKNADPDAYDIFSGIGGQMCIKGRGLFSGARRVSEEFLANPPAIRCVFMPDTTGDDGEIIPAGALYMFKVASGQLLVGQKGFCRIPSEGCAYRMTMTWRDDNKSALVATCFVQILEDGSIKLLAERLPRTQVIKARKKGGGGSFKTMVTSTPGWVDDLARDHNSTTDEWISLVVGMIASAKQPSDAILVRAQKDGMTAAWTIDRRDAKRFFIARDAGETGSGQRKRVLHYVAPFIRTGAHGTQTVREHYRGEREFNWQGYDISVSGLDFHHGNFFDSGVESHEVDDALPVPKNMMTMRQMVTELRTLYSRPKFLSKRSTAAGGGRATGPSTRGGGEGPPRQVH